MSNPKPGQVWRKGEELRRVERVTVTSNVVAVKYRTFDGVAYVTLLANWLAWAKDAQLMNPEGE